MLLNAFNSEHSGGNVLASPYTIVGAGGGVTVVAIIVTAVCDSARPVREAPEAKMIGVLHKMIPLA